MGRQNALNILPLKRVFCHFYTAYRRHYDNPDDVENVFFSIIADVKKIILKAFKKKANGKKKKKRK